MAKSIKLKNNNYWDSKSIVHNQRLLSDLLEENKYQNNYATTEKQIGYWIDGKPLYRKVIHYTGSLTSGRNAIPHYISNLDNIVNKNCFIPFYVGSTKSIYGHGTYLNSTQFVNIGTSNSTDVNLYIGSEWANSFTNGCYIILEYTKI